MELWTSEAWKIVNLVLGNPADQLERWIMIGVGALALIAVMRFAGSATGLADPGWILRVVALGFGVGSMLAAEVAAHLYALPALKSADLQRVAVIVAPILGALLVGIPLQMLTLKARYGQALLAFAAAAIVAVLLAMGARAVLASFRTGRQETESLLQRQSETRGFLRDVK
jgi:hypothetical protein